MNITVFLISLYIFLNTINYGIYEYKNDNKFRWNCYHSSKYIHDNFCKYVYF